MWITAFFSPNILSSCSNDPPSTFSLIFQSIYKMAGWSFNIPINQGEIPAKEVPYILEVSSNYLELKYILLFVPIPTCRKSYPFFLY